MSRRWPSSVRPCLRTTPISPRVSTTWACSISGYAGRADLEEASAIRVSPSLRPPRIAQSLTTWGWCRHLRNTAARRSLEELAIFRKALPPDHPDIANSLNVLGNVQS